ncbi:MAG TPA: sigma-54 dependent transcriptional regulator [Myxococcaceae bacterium]|nr:sigma-54 dependent transcriptional regulator [Myxococcaceae bacterium]
MASIRWLGTASAPLAAGLSARGITRSSDGPVMVVHARRWAEVARPPGPWIWVSPGVIGAAERRAATVAGCYAAIDGRAPGAAEVLVQRVLELSEDGPLPSQDPEVVAESTATRAVLRQVAQAARTSMPVLLTGETGTGKEIAARLLHTWSGRAGRFVPINCAAIPNELMEGELFGYARGAFSGAVHEHDGLVSAATGGTVFLDEIDDTPHALQVKLLRVLEDRVVTRLGDSTPRTVDFRLVAATNRDLRPLIDSGSFGADLYERLAIVSIELPPLRERREDIPRLVEHFIERFYREEPAAAERGRVQTVSAEAMETLTAYRWPGNVRELRNAVFGALVGKRGGTELLLSDLPRRLLGARDHDEHGVVDVVALERALGAGTFDLRAERERLERLALEQALSLARGNAARAAELLGAVGRGEASDPGGTVRAMMRRLGLVTRKYSRRKGSRPS